jgi:hypothetical protein
MAKYLMSIQQPDGPIPSAEFLDEVTARLHQVNEKIKAEGGWFFTGGLTPPASATVVHVRDGQTLVTDGPYVEGKEHVGGLWIVDAPDLDTVLDWATQASAAYTLPIEIRPFAHDGGH